MVLGVFIKIMYTNEFMAITWKTLNSIFNMEMWFWAKTTCFRKLLDISFRPVQNFEAKLNKQTIAGPNYYFHIFTAGKDCP